MKHDYLSLSDAELLDIVCGRIIKSNPRIKLGEKMLGPVVSVWAGKLVATTSILSDHVFSLDFQPPHVEPMKQTIQASSIKVRFSELESLEWSSFVSKYLYPLEVRVPHREWMLNHQPGDTIMVFDDQYDASPLTLTQEHFNQHEYLIFKFGASD